MTSGSGFQEHHNTVNMYGGTGNRGISYDQRTTAPVSFDAGLRELRPLLAGLRAGIPEGDGRTLDEALGVLAEPEAQPQNRRNALMAIIGVAATAGTLGESVLSLARQLLQLLGG
ncbi:hypothetical protein ACIQ9E_24450 [Streptomyces sp. NPDC094448]|uniref:hypothetical protein n=1 Tax=Streptomyces sp. NPDC094448 TaxID=3366063 RepID=UPI00381A5DEB